MIGQMRTARWLLGLVLVACGQGVRAADDFEEDPINYSKATPGNLVSRLQDRLDAGKATLKFDDQLGYLPAVLEALAIPQSSQVLVFSKTSLQRRRISPRTPRALYFNDEVHVGYCRQGEVLEIAATDPQLGAVFYTLDQSGEDKPRFVRQTDHCMLCHASSNTQGVPGHVLRSVFSDHQGMPILSAGTVRVEQTTPLERRWGGWYVTGTHGKQSHLGNLIIRTRHVEQPVDNAAGLNVTDLGERIDRSAYPSAHSDLVALMVLEHQCDALNYLTRANFTTRRALHQEANLNRELKLPADNRWDSTRVRIHSAAEALVKYLLFSDEAPLTDTLTGTSDFAEEFTRRGPRDARGRSLRDFDLKRRLFRYPCSYLIYSESFDALPTQVRDRVLQRMWEVLTGKDTSKPFAHLSPQDRQAIREILVDTKPSLPAYWRESVRQGS